MAQREQRVRAPLLTINIENPVAGLSTILPAAALDPSQSPLMLELVPQYGELVRRPGTEKFGSSSIPLANGPIMGLHPYIREDGTKKFLAMTTRKIYNWNGTEWDTALTQTPGDFTSTDLDQFDSAVMLDTFVFTNGVDEDRKWPLGTGNVVVVLANMSSRYCEAWLNRVIFGYVSQSGTVRAQRIKFPVNGNLADFGGVGSGEIDLLDTPGDITGMKILSSGELAIYKPNFIDVGVGTGVALSPIAIVRGRVEGVGDESPFSLVDANDRHIFLSDEGLKQFDGNSVSDLASGIQNSLFASIAHGRLRTIHAFARPEFNQYYLFVTPTGALSPTILYVVNYAEDTVAKCVLSATASSGEHVTGAPPTIDGSLGTIDAQLGRFDDLNLSASAPIYVVGNTAGNTLSFGDRLPTDDGASILAEWQSKDFRLSPDRQVALSRLDVDAMTTSAAVDVSAAASVDRGATWVAASPATRMTLVGGAYSKLRFYFKDIVGEYIRFRIQSGSALDILTVRSFQATGFDAGAVVE